MTLQTISHLLKQKDKRFYITTSSSLDHLLNGGIPSGTISQIAGESGIGKTQLCFQICLNVQIPMNFGGVDGEAVYLDTENTFQSTRLYEMAEALMHRFQKNIEFSKMTSKRFLSGIYMFRCIDVVQLLAASHQMFEFIKLHPKVKLIVVDSIAHCIRHEEDSKVRIKILNSLAENFRKLALYHNLAIVIVNQVTTRFPPNEQAITVPALGQTWSYIPSTKIMLKKQNGGRYALLYKSPAQPRGMVRFSVTKHGFRDYSNEISRSDDVPSLVLTQNVTNDLLYNDFNASEVCSEKATTNQPEELSEKWLILSQRQLDSTNAINGEYSVFETLEKTFTKEKHRDETSHPNVTLLSNHPTTQDPSSENRKSSERSGSPILLPRPIKKRRKLL